MTEDVASNVDLSSIDLADVDQGGGNLTIKLSTSTGGQLFASDGGGVVVGGSGTASLTLTGGLADLNTYLDSAANITYLHSVADTYGDNADTIEVVFNDNGNSGAGGGLDQTIGTVNVDITAVNDAPTVSLANVIASLSENTDTSSAIKVADIVINDDNLGTNDLTLSGTDAASFEIVGTELRLRAGTSLDFETQTSFDVTVELDDSAVGGTPDDTVAYTLTITDFDEFDVSTPIDSDAGANSVAESATVGTYTGLTADASDADGTTNTVTYSLDDNAGGRFTIDSATGVVTVAGALDYETATSHSVVVRATSADGSSATQSFTIQVTDVNESGVNCNQRQ